MANLIGNKIKSCVFISGKGSNLRSLIKSSREYNFLKKRKFKFLCLAGFMKILSTNFIKNFRYKIVNIHPSLLPKYKGLNTHKRALLKNEKYSGCTVHYVTSELDSGKIILQNKVLINKDETENSLKKKVLKEEHKIYPQSIISIFK